MPSDIHAHTKALQAEISRMARTMSNPVCRSAFELGMNNALQEILGRLESAFSDKEMEPTHHRILREKEGSFFDCAPSKKSSWITRNVRRSDFVLKNFLGTIYVRSKTNVLESSFSTDGFKVGNDTKYEHVTSFCASPLPWLVKLGMGYGLRVNFNNSAIWGWKYSLNTFRQVPDDAMIFEFCKRGNLSGVHTLLSRGSASVRDTDSRGRTALYVSGPLFHF